MAVLLLILGIVVAAAGVVAIGFGIPLSEFTVGTTLMGGGATALTGGFILIGLSAVVTELSRLADAVKGGATAWVPRRADQMFEAGAPGFPATPIPPPVAVSSPRSAGSGISPPPRSRPEAPPREPRPLPLQQPSPAPVDVSAAAIERLRSAIPRAEGPRAEMNMPAQGEETPLSPNGQTQYAGAGRGRSDAPAPEPKVTAEDRTAAAVDTLKSSRLDFLFRSKPAAPAPEPPNFDTIWPADRAARNARQPEAVQRTAEPAEAQPAPAAPAAEPETAQTPPPVSVLKSGVVDGMAYTLYTDGSIEAKLPQGTVRFASVAELRAHIESGS
jgi:hypothetical protein